MKLIINPKQDAELSAETIRTLVAHALSMCDVEIRIENRDGNLNGMSTLEIEIGGDAE